VSRTGRFLFWPGQIVATPGAIEAFSTSGESPFDFLMRHLTGDWGDLDAHDLKANEVAVEQGLRVLSAYHLSDGTKFWIITEADRSSTCYLLPDEY
jgi:hypothetical protein